MIKLSWLNATAFTLVPKINAHLDLKNDVKGHINCGTTLLKLVGWKFSSLSTMKF